MELGLGLTLGGGGGYFWPKEAKYQPWQAQQHKSRVTNVTVYNSLIAHETRKGIRRSTGRKSSGETTKINK